MARGCRARSRAVAHWRRSRVCWGRSASQLPPAHPFYLTSAVKMPIDDLGPASTSVSSRRPLPWWPQRSALADMLIGRAAAAGIQPLDTFDTPDPAAHYALLSIGMSNTTQK